MSYKRTVRCRFCYKTGHNIKGCPERKAYIKEHLGDNTPEGRRAAVLQEAYDSKSSRRERRCKYCRSTGHDIRTCPDIAQKVAVMTDKCLDARRYFADRMVEVGFGPGSLVRYRSERYWNNDIQDYEYKYSLGLVEKINWKEITHHCKRDTVRQYAALRASVLVTPVNPSSAWRKGRMVHLPVEIGGYMEKEERGMELSKLLSGTASDIPDSFLDEKNVAKLMREKFLIETGLAK